MPSPASLPPSGQCESLAERLASTAPIWQRAPEAVRGLTDLSRALWWYRWQLAEMGEHVAIGPRCRFINGHRMVIGDGCQIAGPGRFEVVLLSNAPPNGPILRLGSRVTIEQNVHISAAHGVTIEDHVSLSANVAILEAAHPRWSGGSEPPATAMVARVAPIIIRRGVLVGINAVIMPGVEIGEGARVGANAVVTRSVPAGATVAGVPARPV